MYYIEYHKNAQSKPTIEIPNQSSDSRKQNSMKKRRYLHQQDIIDKCWNIKSLTIEVADIKNAIYDHNLKHLKTIYAKINRLNINDTDYIIILNNNNVNLLYIYEIITCDWMINKEENSYSEELLLQKIKKLNYYIDLYEKTTKDSYEIELKNQIHLFKYWINSLNSKNITQNPDTKVLKLGKNVINFYKRTDN